MADTNTNAAAAATKPTIAAKPTVVAKPKGEPKPKAAPKPQRYDVAGKVTLLTDKDGKIQYGPVTDEKATPLPTKNPKRGKSAERFACYKNGITVGELQKLYEKTGGSVYADLDWDIKHGFVSYTAPATPTVAAAPEAAKA